MNETFTIVLYSCAAGLPIIIGGLISFYLQKRSFKYKNEWNHFITAFGGGALLSAIAFVLIPEAVSDLTLLEIIFIFISGTVAFMLLDILGSRLGGSVAQVISMMMDFIPEALALGASFALHPSFGLLIAIFIGLQNLPEGYNSFLELSTMMSKRNALFLMLGLSFVGIFAALTGEMLLSENGKLLDSIMLFAGGGILYLIFQDIAPLAKVEKDWLPATGASFGFLLGMIGEKILK